MAIDNQMYMQVSSDRNQFIVSVIIDYKGKQFIIELKIWRGDEYNQRARQQIFEYLDYYQKEEGYLLSFNFNRNKETGIKEIEYKGKNIIETVV